jgi:hypothetical protein
MSVACGMAGYMPNIKNSDDISGEFKKYWNQEKQQALEKLCEEEELNKDELNKVIQKYTLDFIDVMIEQFPFPIQRIQCDRGNEFFAVKVQEKLMEYSIKFRPVKPVWREGFY